MSARIPVAPRGLLDYEIEQMSLDLCLLAHDLQGQGASLPSTLRLNLASLEAALLSGGRDQAIVILREARALLRTWGESDDDLNPALSDTLADLAELVFAADGLGAPDGGVDLTVQRLRRAVGWAVRSVEGDASTPAQDLADQLRQLTVLPAEEYPELFASSVRAAIDPWPLAAQSRRQRQAVAAMNRQLQALAPTV